MRTMLSVALSLSLAIITAAAFGCASGTPGDTNGDPTGRGTITGTVVRDDSGKPIQGATVTLVTNTAPKTATTDAKGAFILTDVLYGTYTLNAVYSPPGTNLSGTAKVTVSAEAKNPTVTIKLKGTSGPPPPPF